MICGSSDKKYILLIYKELFKYQKAKSIEFQ